MKSSYSTQCKINRLLMVLAALAAVNWLPRSVAAAPLAQGTQPTAIYLPLVMQEIQPPTTSSNQAPTVMAGPDQTVIFPIPANLHGAVSDDGLPNPPGRLSIEWRKISGPAEVVFSQPNAVDTAVTFTLAGEYLLQLTASDQEQSASDQVTVTVIAENQSPIVDAGPDQTITLPASAQLSGIVNDDGLPNPPAHLTTTWSQTSGPGTVTFADPNAVDTTATFSAAGAYSLRLTVDDGLLTNVDDLAVQVNPAAVAAGHWAGTTSRNYPISFDVATGGAQESNFVLTTNFAVPECGSSGVLTITVTSAAPIVDNRFNHNSLDFDFAGEFTTPTAASGSYAFTNYRMIMSYPFPPYICIGYFNQSGTWTASKAD